MILLGRGWEAAANASGLGVGQAVIIRGSEALRAPLSFSGSPLSVFALLSRSSLCTSELVMFHGRGRPSGLCETIFGQFSLANWNHVPERISRHGVFAACTN